VRGAFHTTRHQTPFVPSARPGGRIEGPAPIFPLVILSAAKYLASPSLKQCGVRWRACRILLTPRRSFSPPASYFLSTATRSNQEAPPRSLRRPIAFFCKFTLPSLARHRAFSHPLPGHPWPCVRIRWSDIESLHLILTPALLARGGFHPQAIHGLWVKSSASCLAPRLRAGLFAADSDARRSQTGRNIKSTSKAKATTKSRTLASVFGRLRCSWAALTPHLPFVDPVMHAITKPWRARHTW